MSGPELQAASIATALDGLPAARRRPAGSTSLLVVLLAAVAPLVALRFGAARRVAAPAVVATALFLVGAQLAFNAGDRAHGHAGAGRGGDGRSSARCWSSAPRRSSAGEPASSIASARARACNRRTRRLRTLLLLGAALFCTVGGLGLMALDGLRRLDLTSVDMRFDVRGARAGAGRRRGRRHRRPDASTRTGHDVPVRPPQLTPR